MRITNIEDGTKYGYDISEKGEKATYYIIADLFGNEKHIAIWNPSNVLHIIHSYKEALTLLEIARNKPTMPLSTYKIVRNFEVYNIKDYDVIDNEKEERYYAE